MTAYGYLPPRPTLAVLIGNGMSIDFARHANSLHRLRFDVRPPPCPGVSRNFNPDRDSGISISFSIGAHDGPVRWRQNTWARFANYEYCIRTDPALAAAFDTWPWTADVAWLMAEFRPAFISYNYERIAEELAARIAPGPVRVYPGRRGIRLPFDSDQPLFIKPHGCVCFRSMFLDMVHGPVAKVSHCVDMSPFSLILPGPQVRAPALPDLIPPGGMASQSIHPRFDDFLKVYRVLVQRAQAVVAIGLALEEPDASEFKEVVETGLHGKTFIHVVPCRDADDAKIIAAVKALVTRLGSRYVHCDALEPGRSTMRAALAALRPIS